MLLQIRPGRDAGQEWTSDLEPSGLQSEHPLKTATGRFESGYGASPPVRISSNDDLATSMIN